MRGRPRDPTCLGKGGATFGPFGLWLVFATGIALVAICVAMAATVGYLYNDLQLNFPGTLSPSASLKFADVPTGLAATHGFPNSVPIAGWVQIIGFIGVLETTTFKQDPAKEAGNVGGDLFRRYSDPAERETKLISELKNGRLAMMGIMGMLVTDQLTGMGPISWLIKDGSPFGVVGSKLTF